MRLQQFKLEGYEQQIKTAGKKSESASVIWLPGNWTGKKVAVILLEPVEGSDSTEPRLEDVQE